jgi:hypothetical protein
MAAMCAAVISCIVVTAAAGCCGSCSRMQRRSWGCPQWRRRRDCSCNVCSIHAGSQVHLGQSYSRMQANSWGCLQWRKRRNRCSVRSSRQLHRCDSCSSMQKNSWGCAQCQRGRKEALTWCLRCVALQLGAVDVDGRAMQWGLGAACSGASVMRSCRAAVI